MKRFTLLVCSLVFLGAGCFGGGGSTGSDGGVLKTFNAGDDWSQAVIVPTASGIGTLATSNILNMEMDPQDHNYLYVGTRSSGMLYSEDAGASWRQVRNSALSNGTIYTIEVDPTDVCKVYVAKGSRLYATNDCMRSFDDEVYLDSRGQDVVQVAIDWYDPNNIWIGLDNGDVLKSQDAGRTWQTSFKTGGEISEILISNTDTRQVLVSTFKKGIYRTTDSGNTWTDVNDALDAFSKGDQVYSLIQSRDAGVVIAASVYGLLRSTDFGETWEAIKLITSPGQVMIRAIGMDVNNPMTLYYASNATFYHSNDGGSTWKTDRIPTSRTPRAMLVDPEDPTVLYLGVATEIK
jgi:photosystem II stability/assembly factor-like uncharacterized protein